MVVSSKMTRAIQMCREAGEDPEYQEYQPPVCRECGRDADCMTSDHDYYCGDCWCELL